ncbi:MAG: transglutaminase-like cysteine peptidase [Hyphomonadaceae bacterium]|nr:transglutaminase-like cysteine peptidase [Hyphomonadaceae bacterium]
MWACLKVLCVAAAAVCAASCAAPGAARGAAPGAVLAQIGPPTAPPAGLAALCVRRPDICPTSSAVRRTAAGPQEALFQALLLSERTPAPRRDGVALTAERAALLADVNARINRAMTFTTDAEAVGVDERWSFPLTAPDAPTRAGRVRGDCEDFALEKRAALLAAGWPAEHLSLATAYAPQLGLHAVLIAHTDEGDIALDMLRATPVSVARLGYRWIAAQRGADLLTWRVVRLVGLSEMDVAPRIGA